MAFKLQSGVSGMPGPGDTIHVYQTGTTTAVSGLKTADSAAGDLSNPFTVPAAAAFYGFEPPSSARVDVWWVEGNRYLIEDVNVRDTSLDIAAALDFISGEVV